MNEFDAKGQYLLAVSTQSRGTLRSPCQTPLRRWQRSRRSTKLRNWQTCSSSWAGNKQKQVKRKKTKQEPLFSRQNSFFRLKIHRIPQRSWWKVFCELWGSPVAAASACLSLPLLQLLTFPPWAEALLSCTKVTVSSLHVNHFITGRIFSIRPRLPAHRRIRLQERLLLLHHYHLYINYHLIGERPATFSFLIRRPWLYSPRTRGAKRRAEPELDKNCSAG